MSSKRIRERVVAVYFHPAEFRRIERVARASGVGTSTLIRSITLRQLPRVARAVGPPDSEPPPAAASPEA